MATTSGTFKGSRGGNSYGPWLELDWARQQIDIPNNRSLIRLTLRLHSSYTLKFTARKSGKLHGSSFTYTGNFNGTGSKVLSTRDVWVNHNADGSKSQSFSASFNVAVSWGGSHLSSISVSGTANITAVPRASTLSAFSFGANLKNGVANSIKYIVDRKSGNFRHQIQLRDGNTTIWTWDNQNTDGSNTIPLTASNVNTLLNRMTTVTSKTFTLRVTTRSGSGGSLIGSAVSKTAKAKVHDDVKPTVSAVTVSQTGNSVSTHYLQGKSKVKASFTRTAGYGASISSSSIQVRRKTSNTDVQTINSNDGTTSKAVSLTGTYEARGTTRDGRGRTNNTAWKEFTVTAYSSPKITSFSAVRLSDTPTTVSIYRGAKHTSLGGANSARMLIEKRIGSGAWSTVQDSSDSSGAWGNTLNDTGNSVTSSYEFRVTLTDAFGEISTASVTVPTQQVVLDIHKDEGVGIGKIHERGSLDVEGIVHISDRLYIDGFMNRFNTTPQGDTPKNLNDISMSGAYRLEDRNAAGVANYPDHPGISWGQMLNIRGGSDTNVQMAFPRNDARAFFLRTGSGASDSGFKGPLDWQPFHSIEQGSNGNGQWIKFGDGTLICWHSSSSTKNWSWTYGHRFAGGTPKVFAMGVVDSRMWQSSKTETAVVINSNVTTSRQAVAIGRWR